MNLCGLEGRELQLNCPCPAWHQCGEKPVSILKNLEKAGAAVVPIEATDKMMRAGVAAAQKKLPNAKDEVGHVQIRAAWDAMVKEALKDIR